MHKNFVITEEYEDNIFELANKFGVSIDEKRVFVMDIHLIIPNTFHPALWRNNWMFAYDILTNGESFNEVYILKVEKLKDLELLYKEQIDVIREHSFIVS